MRINYNIKRIFKKYLLVVLLSMILIANISIAESQSLEKIKIAVVPPTYASLLRLALGSYVDVISPIPPGVDPHTYEGTPQDIQRALQADLIIVDVIGHLPITTKLIDAAKASGKPYIILYEELIKRGWEPLKKPTGVYNEHIGFDYRAQILLLEIVRDKVLEIAREKYSPQEYIVISSAINSSTQEAINVINSSYSYARYIVSGLKGVAIYSAAGQYMIYSLGLEPVYVLTPEPEQEPTPQSLQGLKNSGARCVLILQGTEEYSDAIISTIKSMGVTPVIVNVRETIMKNVPYLAPVVVALELKRYCGSTSSEASITSPQSMGAGVNTYMIVISAVIIVVIILVAIYYYTNVRHRVK